MRNLLIAEFYSTPWAIQAHAYAVMCEVLERWAAGVQLSAEEIRAAIGEAPEVVAQRRAAAARAGQGVVAVLPVYGILTQRGNMVSDVSGPGGTSVARLAQAFNAAVADETVAAIVLDVDSPGGSVYGISELAQQIYDARAAKPVIAVANSQAASAAYWLSASASEVVITPSGEAGSIGVITEHKDDSKAEEAKGVTRTVVSAGKYKAEGAGPLTAEARAALQERVDAYYETMVKDIARGRNVAQKAVREGFGEGRTLGSARAVKEGLADRVATLDQVLGELVSRGRPGGARAQAPAPHAKASPAQLRDRDF
jgi:signal peptide peptidase SppA